MTLLRVFLRLDRQMKAQSELLNILFGMFRKCRACLCDDGDDMKFLTNTNLEGENLIETFKAIVGFEWINNEKIASYLCRKCETSLLICHEFRKKCIKSNETLKQYLATEGSMDDETIESVDELVQNENERLIVVIKRNKKRKRAEIETNKNEVPEVKDLEHSQGGTKQLNTVRKKNASLQQFPPDEVQTAIDMYKMKNEPLSYQCLICPYILGSKTSIGTHMNQMHEEVKSRWCRYCNKLLDNLPQHLEEHKRLVETCQFCGKTIKKPYFVQHLRAHSAKPYSCEQCSKCFTTNLQLSYHQLIHDKEQENANKSSIDCDDDPPPLNENESKSQEMLNISDDFEDMKTGKNSEVHSLSNEDTTET